MKIAKPENCVLLAKDSMYVMLYNIFGARLLIDKQF